MAEITNQYGLLIEPEIMRLRNGDTSNAANQVGLKIDFKQATDAEFIEWNAQIPATQERAKWLSMYEQAGKVLRRFGIGGQFKPQLPKMITDMK